MNYKVFDCLSEKTIIEGQKLLEASAGTGKTFAIEHIVVRLVLSKVMIDGILVVTFTNLATDELKGRILANLKHCYAMLKERQIEPAFPYLKKYFENSHALNEAVVNLQNAISFFDNAQIFTIHSFCKRSLQEYSFEAELAFSGVGETVEKQVLQSKLKRIFLNPKLKEIFFSSSFDHFLKNKNMDVLVTKVMSNMSRCLNVDQLKHISIDAILKKVKHDFEEGGFVKLDYEHLLSDFWLNSNNYKKTGFTKDDFEEQIKLISEVSFDFFNLKAWDKLLFHKFSIGKFFLESNLKQKAKAVKGANYPSFFSFLSDKIYPQLMIFFDSEYFLNELIYNFKDDLISQIDKVNSLSADKLLEMMETSLNNLSFKNAIKQKYKAAIIDEFQDTDRIQWNIFLKAFLSSPKIPFFYLVGDPKQSIYAFRNADVYTYLKASNYLGEVNKYFLDTNYRSTKSLVDSLNTLFDRKWLHLPKLNRTLEYHPVKASNQLDTTTPIHYMIADEKGCSNIENEMFFPFFVSEIIKKGSPYSQYAILVKDRFQEQRLQSFLFSHNIPCSARKGLIHETHAYDCLKQILQVILEPNNISNLKILMLSLNYKLKDLEDSEKLNYFLMIFNQLHTLFKNKGIEGCLSKLIDLCFHGYSLVERIAQKDLFSNTDLTDAINLLLEYALKNHISENSLKIFYTTVEKSMAQRQAIASEDAVQILTVHKSKGLEFEIVFCLGVAFAGSTHALETQNKEEIEAEKLRQLYVALTRAKSALYIPIIVSKSVKKSFSSIDLFIQSILDSHISTNVDSLKALLQGIHGQHQCEVTILQRQNKASDHDNSFTIENFLNNYSDQKSDSNFLSFTSVSRPYAIEKKDQDCKSFPPGAISGVIIHKILEELFLKKSKMIELKKFLKDTPLEEFEKQIEDIINKLLEIKLAPFKFSLKDIDFNNLTTELEFCYKLGNNKMKGFIDLMFCYQGKYFIIDWKTNFLGNEDSCYENKKLYQTMKQHDYFLQGSIYSDALQKLLSLFNQGPFSEKFGGVFFVFLRGLHAKGNGLFHYFPSAMVNK